MPKPIRAHYQGEAIQLGITIFLLGVQTNPSNGVKITLIDPAGGTEVDAQAMTQGQYDEDNSTTTGQYFYIFNSDTDDVVGFWRAEFDIDPAGTNPGRKIKKEMFKMIAD